MVIEQKMLKYKGKIIFEKIRIKPFSRIPKIYEDNEFCFMFINQGGFKVRSQDSLIQFQEGNALLAKCFNYFFEIEEKKRNDYEEMEMLGVIFHESIIEEIFRYDLSISNFSLDFNIKKINVEGLFLSFKESINILLDNPELADDSLILTKLKEFILLLTKTQNAPSVLDFLSSMFRPVEYDFKKTIEKNLFSNLSVDELAKLCNMSASTFKRKFNSVYKKSPAQYLLEKKIEKAILEISKNQKPITEIAYDCGFDSISTFNRNFKKHTSFSPTEFKKNQNLV